MLYVRIMFSAEIENSVFTVEFSDNGSLWYELLFLSSLVEILENGVDGNVRFFLFQARKLQWGGKELSCCRQLHEKFDELANIICSNELPVFFLAEGELRDGLAGLFLAADMRFCIKNCSLKYTMPPCFGEITSLKKFKEINPALLLSGAVDYNVSSLKDSGLLNEKFSSHKEWRNFLSELTELSGTSIAMIKELVRNESYLNFRQGNMLERKHFGLRYSRSDCGTGLKNFLENRNK